MPALSKKGLMRLRDRIFSEEYDLLMEALKASGFYNTNGAVNTIADYIDYKAYLLYEDFEDDYGHKFFMEIGKEVTPKGTSYHINEVNIE